MKKLFLLVLFGALSQFAYSQVMVGEVDINELDLHYIEIYSGGGLVGVVRINYGQAPATLLSNFDPLLDPEGKPFKNHIAAINFLSNHGWELLLTGKRLGEESSPAFLLKRKEQ